MKRIKKPKYIVAGGNPFLTNTAGLRVLGTAQNEEQVRKIVEDNYYECVGLMIIIDAETGCKVDEASLNIDYELFQAADSSPLPELPEQLPIQ
jgi:hypothetical protein